MLALFAVEFDGQRLSLHNPPTSDLDQEFYQEDAERIDDFSDDFRGERGVDATGATQQVWISCKISNLNRKSGV